MANSEPTDTRLLRLAPTDNVLVAITALPEGTRLSLAGGTVQLAQSAPLGFKIAARDILAGAKVIKYGAPIGSATTNIKAGEIVHLHNMRSDYLPTHTLPKEPRYGENH